MNPKGKKFKNTQSFSFFSPCKLFFFQTFSIFLLQTQNFWPEDRWKILLYCGRMNHLAPQCFNRKKEPVKAQSRGKGEHEVNMEELNSNSFRLDSSLPIVNSITFFLDWWLDSEANIHICTDRSWLNPIRKTWRKREPGR